MPKKSAAVIELASAKLAKLAEKLSVALTRRQQNREAIGKLLFELQGVLKEENKWLEWLRNRFESEFASTATAYRYIEFYKQSDEYREFLNTCETPPQKNKGGRPKGSGSAVAASAGNRRGRGGGKSSGGTGARTNASPGNTAASPPLGAETATPAAGGSLPPSSPATVSAPTPAEIVAFLDRVPGNVLQDCMANYLVSEAPQIARAVGRLIGMVEPSHAGEVFPAAAPEAPETDAEVVLAATQTRIDRLVEELRQRDARIDEIKAENQRAAKDYVQRKETQIRGLNDRIAVLEEENAKFKGKGAYARNSEEVDPAIEKRIEALGKRLAEADQENARLRQAIDSQPDKGQLANQALVIEQLRADKKDLKETLDRVRAMPPAMYANKFGAFEPAQRHEIMRLMSMIDDAEPGAYDAEKADWIAVIYSKIHAPRYRADIYGKLTKLRATEPRMRDAPLGPPQSWPPRSEPGSLLKPDPKSKRGNGRPPVPDENF